MFDIGWSEMLIIGVVALVVLGPKELPGALKTFAYWTKQARKLAREFQSGVDEMIRTAELDEAKKLVEDTKRSINREIENSIDPTGEVKKAVSETQKSVKASLASEPTLAAKTVDRTSPVVPAAIVQAAPPPAPPASAETGEKSSAPVAEERLANG